MATILDRYGIKEVADVTFYKINEDGTPGAPVYYFDTLKVSTIEQTSENTSARGGKGNPELIVWDYNKEVTLTIEDALFSPKSLALMMGAEPTDSTNGKILTLGRAADCDRLITSSDKVTGYKWLNGAAIDIEAGSDKYYDVDGQEVTDLTTASFVSFQIKLNSDVTDVMTFVRRKGSDQVSEETATGLKFTILDADYTGNVLGYYKADGAVAAYTDYDYVKFTVPAKNMTTIDISPDKFSGTYYITGDTYARNEATGEDEMLQFICRKGKVNTENTLTMEAEGDPSTYEMTIKVMKPKTGAMLSLVKYELGN